MSRRDEVGATAVEHGLMIALVVAIVVIAVVEIASRVPALFS